MKKKDNGNRHHKKTLSFFRDVETMTIPDAPQLGTGFGKAIELSGTHTTQKAPWERGRGINAYEATIYVVHLGVERKRTFVESILSALDPTASIDHDEMTEVSGYSSVGSLVLDWEGRLINSYIHPAPFVYCIRRLRDGKSLHGIDKEIENSVKKAISDKFGALIPLTDPFAPQNDTKTISEEQSAELDKISIREDEEEKSRTHHVHEIPATILTLLQVSRGLMDVANLPKENAHIRVVSYTIKGKKRRTLTLPSVEDAMMPSFYSHDIGRVINKLDKIEQTSLHTYLSDPTSPNLREDILKDTNSFSKLLTPETLTQSRWPSPPSHSLNIAQQAAVSMASDPRHPLVSVNGPPGTGKTTLLRDIIAQAILKRAQRLAGLSDPAKGIIQQTVKPKQKDQDPFDISIVDPDIMQGTSIVVTSNNNAAVENISLELPQKKAIDTEAFPNANYLQQAAKELALVIENSKDRNNNRKKHTLPLFDNQSPLPEDHPANVWGLMALRMGNKDNINTALDGLNPFTGKEQKRGLVETLRTLKPLTKKEWNKLCSNFERAQTKVNTLIKIRKDNWNTHLSLPYLEDLYKNFLPLEDIIKSSLPWIEDLELSKKTHKGRSFIRIRQSYFHHCPQAQDDMDLYLYTHPQTKGLEFQRELKNRLTIARIQTGYYQTKWHSPTSEFFNQSFENYHKKSVWTTEELEIARSELLISAMKLHEGFLRWNWKDLYGLLKGMRRVLGGESMVDGQVLLDIWNSVFILSPVVSTTLASIRKLPAKAGWIGTLLIDEAGQATPQSIVGALFRSQKAIIVGDPLQIEPVFTVPSPIVTHFLEEKNIDPRFSPLLHSAQSVADGTMRYGAWVEQGKTKVWTGLPLRVHRRCQDPMFSISNTISYNKQMVQGAPELELDTLIQGGFGQSMWLDVNDDAGVDKIKLQEMEALKQCLARFDKQGWPQNTQTGKPLEVFTISPFYDVAMKCKDVSKQILGRHAYTLCPTGTVHTFQGREADIVFLVLGSAAGEKGAHSRRWAAKHANLLNVALTRARLAVYVIGSTQDWKTQPYFETLYQSLSNNNRIKSFPR